tara:strand:+ start:1402 stop:2085 length:684 start_codon:yes stop_codon:yes gene_type:complete
MEASVLKELYENRELHRLFEVYPSLGGDDVYFGENDECVFANTLMPNTLKFCQLLTKIIGTECHANSTDRVSDERVCSDASLRPFFLNLYVADGEEFGHTFGGADGTIEELLVALDRSLEYAEFKFGRVNYRLGYDDYNFYQCFEQMVGADGDCLYHALQFLDGNCGHRDVHDDIAWRERLAERAIHLLERHGQWTCRELISWLDECDYSAIYKQDSWQWKKEVSHG